jgi:hypothetical protein
VKRSRQCLVANSAGWQRVWCFCWGVRIHVIGRRPPRARDLACLGEWRRQCFPVDQGRLFCRDRQALRHLRRELVLAQ